MAQEYELHFSSTPPKTRLVRCDITYWACLENMVGGFKRNVVYISDTALMSLQSKDRPEFICFYMTDDPNSEITLIQSDNINEISQLKKLSFSNLPLDLLEED